MNEWEKIFYNNISIYLLVINEELAKKYPSVSLSKHVQLVGGYAFKSTEYKNQGIPIIRISDFQDEKIVLNEVVYYNESSELEKYVLKSGDIIIALTGGTIGKLAIVQKGLGKLYLNQRVAKFFVINPDVFTHEYVYWVARGVQGKIKKLAWGGAQPNVSTRQIEEMEFPIPDTNTQQGIVRFLNDLKNNTLQNETYFNNKIEKRIIELHYVSQSIFELSKEHNAQGSYLQQFRKSIFQEAIEGKLTADWRKKNLKLISGDNHASKLIERIKVENGNSRKEKLLLPITDTEKLYVLPDGWVWCRLGDVCTKITDGFHNTPPKLQEGIPYISATHVKSDKIDWEGCDFVSKVYHKELWNKAYPIKGEILIVNIGAGCGTPAIIDVDFEFSFKNTAILKFNQELLSNWYLFFYLLSVKEKNYVEITQGGLQPFLSLRILNNILVPLPPLAEQGIIVDRIKSLMAMTNELEVKIKVRKGQSEMLMQSVLREAFSR